MTPAAATPPAAPNRRERVRAATIEEIKRTALDLIRETGTVDIQFTAIARAMGLTAPALYRYFADRGELLTALVADSFNDLAATLDTARASVAPDDLGGRLLAACQAYRHWAAGDPERFALIFGVPVPGYTAPHEGPTTEAAHRAMSNLAGLVLDTARAGRLRPPAVTQVSEQFAELAGRKAHTEMGGGGMTPEIYQGMLVTWAALHGFVALEAHGHFHWMEPAVRDELFVAHVRAVAGITGLVAP